MKTVSELPRVTVIVPAYNEITRIPQCIQALKAQSYPAARLQIIIVDNGSSDGTLELLQRTPDIVALQELRPGSYAARNFALQYADAEIVGFTDADCVPDKDWILNAVQHLTDPQIGIVAGHVELDYGHDWPFSVSELWEQCFAFRQADNARNKVCVTANWFSYLALLRSMRGFDDTVKSGGDYKLSAAISAAGYKVVYAADAIVHHPARTSIGELVRKRRRVIGGIYMTRWRSIWRFPLFVALLIRDELLRIGKVLTRMSLPIWDRLRLSGLMLLLCSSAVAEAFRLRIGGEPRRQ
jgi:cellulose synthase/poly-beta-1,6-N-acetylglucosamine synthase-like glycosyltransferase